MIAACVPALHPVYDKVVKRMTGHKPIDCECQAPPPGPAARLDRRHGFWTIVMKGISQTSGTTLNTATDHSRSVVSAVPGLTPAPAPASAQLHWRQDDFADEKQDVAAPSAVVASTVPMRSLEDAADVQNPPDAIWTQRVNGVHGVRRQVRV